MFYLLLGVFWFCYEVRRLPCNVIERLTLQLTL
jgi:hypothetical protein